MKIEDIMSKKIITADINDYIYDVAKKMLKNDIGFIPVCDNNKIIGVITDRDIVIKIVANNDDKIKDYIQRGLVYIKSDASIEEALKLMGDKQVKRLLVIKNDLAVGVISLSDIMMSININVFYQNICKIFSISKNDHSQNIKINDFEL